MRLDRSDCAYAPYYCEENVWHLARHPQLAEAERFALFITNRDRSCALWSQRSAPDPRSPVVWDYHVVLLATEAGEALVFDLDTVLSFPVPLAVYVASSFPMADRVPARFAPLFRLVPAADYVARFASDRSHMRTAEGFTQPPPPWPCIRTRDETMNLPRYLDLGDEDPGEVSSLSELLARFPG